MTPSTARAARLRHTLVRWLPSTILLLIAATAWVVLQQLDDDPSTTGGSRSDRPDFYMENFVTTVMGPDGSPDRVLKAKKLEHFPDTKTKELDEPYLILYQTGAPAWHVRSETGWISASGDLVLLQGAVHAWRTTDTGERIIDIHTRDLRILPGTDYGETDRPVTIATADQRTVGMGMRAFLNESRLELMAQVRTQVTGHLSQD